MSQIKERPILFSAPMVRAILKDRKTVTRRAVKGLSTSFAVTTAADESPLNAVCWNVGGPIIRCPYGKPGDRLWVREAFGLQVGGTGEHIVYRATNPNAIYCKSAEGRECPVKWKPSIHMPRHSSRILLEITAVRVEQLQDISDEQAKAEGIVPHVRGGWHWHPHNPSDVDDWHQFGFKTPVFAFYDLWAGINGQESWDANPWVWVVEFKRVTP